MYTNFSGEWEPASLTHPGPVELFIPAKTFGGVLDKGIEPNRRSAGYGAKCILTVDLQSERAAVFNLRSLPPAAILALLLAASAATTEDQPRLLPSRDVDITYDVTRPQQPKSRQRVRWLSSEHLERVDASGRSTTIFDRDAHAITLLTPATRTFRKLDHAPRRASEPEPGAVLKRGEDAVVAGVPCTEWSWTDDTESHTVCATGDGVILRLVVDGQTFFEARSVKYGPQKAELFRVPPSYTPALAPEGAGEP